MMPSEFTPRKVIRKLQSDGMMNAVVNAADLFTRKRVGRRVFDPLIDRGFVRTLSRQELKVHAVESVEIVDDHIKEPSPFVSRIKHGYVLTETGLLTTTDFKIIEESAATPAQAQQAMMAMSSRELFFGHLPVRGILSGKWSGKPEVLDAVAPVIPRYPSNYYHWMVETVPKLRFLREYEKLTGTDISILIPSGGPRFIEETLELIDWPRSKIVRAVEPLYHVHNLIVPSFPERTPTDFNWIRGEILGSLSTEQTPVGMGDGNNIYITRANAVERRVLNEDQVMDVLEDYGFTRYRLEDQSVEENVKLFNNADVIVGPHGAGLTDMIFCSDCTIVELFGKKIKRPYEILAETLGLNYMPMYCTAESVDIIVDIDELLDMVSKVVSKR